MPAFFSALGHLLWQSLINLVGGWMATSLLALAVGAINYFIAPRIDARLHGEKPMKSPKLTGSIIATVSTWLLLYSISIISTIYRDHRALVTSNQKLTAALVPQEQQIEQLRAQLGEACYRPDRHLTKEQEKLLFEALNGLAERTPANQRKIIMSTTWDDLESRRYMQELWNVLYRAGWNVPDKPYFRYMPRNDNDLRAPGGHMESLTISYTADQRTEEYKKQNRLLYAIMGAFKGASQDINEGAIESKDPLKQVKGLVLWVGPKP